MKSKCFRLGAALLFLAVYSCKRAPETANFPLRINVGGPAIGEPNSDFHWASSEAFVKKGATFSFPGDHDLSQVEFPGPVEIYHSVIHQDHRYTIPDVPAGEYVIRFHFSEGSDTGKRAMDFLVNEKLMIDDLDVLNVAGGEKKAHVVDIQAVQEKQGNLVIKALQDWGDDVHLSGLEIFTKGYKNTAPPTGWGSVQPPTAIEPETIQQFTEGQARFVWVQSDKFYHYTSPKSSKYLMGLDTTEDGGKERAILETPGAFGKPMMTPDGQRVVFSDLATQEIFVVGWDGSEKTKVARGYASDVWTDPETEHTWVYFRKDDLGTTAPIYRKRIDGLGVEEPIWTATENGHKGTPWFQKSGDGRKFSDAFPWGAASGTAYIGKGEWKQYAKGCWPSMAPDNSYRTFIFTISHRDIAIYDEGATNERIVDISGMKGNNGRKVYYPRWSNHPRFLTVTAPEGSPFSELYLGKFNSDFSEIEGWIKVTSNLKAELFGDAWIQQSESVESLSVTLR